MVAKSVSQSSQLITNKFPWGRRDVTKNASDLVGTPCSLSAEKLHEGKHKRCLSDRNFGYLDWSGQLGCSWHVLWVWTNLLCNTLWGLIVGPLSWNDSWILFLDKKRLQKRSGLLFCTFKTPTLHQPVKDSQSGRDRI